MSGRASGVALCALALAVGACHSAASTSSDGSTADARLSGWYSFDVTASLTSIDGPPFSGTSAFAMTFDADALLVVVGQGAVLPVTTADGRTFNVREAFATAGQDGGFVTYSTCQFTIEGAGLRGTAQGLATTGGKLVATVQFSATLSGVADLTAPVIRPRETAPSLGPFVSLSFTSSEALPDTASLALVATDGTRVALVPEPGLAAGGIGTIVGFHTPPTVLPYGKAYALDVKGARDFAGNAPVSEPPLRIGTLETPPLVEPDGFESVHVPSLGGAAVVSSGDLAPLAGGTSLYIGTAIAPAHQQYMPGSMVRLRVPVPPGGKTLRFSYAWVAASLMVKPNATLMWGSVGASFVRGGLNNGPNTAQALASGGTVYIDAPQTLSVSLPPDAGDELLIQIEVTSSVPIDPVGLLLDDLRIE